MKNDLVVPVIGNVLTSGLAKNTFYGNKAVICPPSLAESHVPNIQAAASHSQQVLTGSFTGGGRSCQLSGINMNFVSNSKTTCLVCALSVNIV